MIERFNRLKISLVINYIIVILTLFSLFAMFVNYKFMGGVGPILETSSFGMFKYFTIQSNILVCISAILFIIEEKKQLEGRIKKIPTKYYIFKYVGTVSVSLTFVVVFTYLSRIVNGGILSLLMNSNLFFHLIIPILSVLSFTVFEKCKNIKFFNIFYGLIPIVVYAVYYLGNILLHLEDGKVSYEYDWYWFVQGGIKQAFIVVPGIFMITLAICLALWFMNKKA